MPCSIEIPLDKRQVDRLPRNAIPALHANFFRWIEESDPVLAREIDRAQGAKPFTVSPLFVEQEWASFRVTLLQDALFDHLEAGMQKRPWVNVLGDDMPISGPLSVVATTYPLLASESAASGRFILRFRSPVSFRRNGKDYPLPEPELVFDSYRRRWNEFGPEALRIGDEWLAWVRECIAISRFDLHTVPMRFPDGLQIGCVGRVQFEVIGAGARDSAALQILAELVEYAFYCGTGRKTTQGMGQTQRLGEWDG